MKVKYVSIFTIVLVLVSGVPLFSGPGVINNANARYAPANTQTQADSNECDTGSNCAINSPQTQGDGTANSPMNLQFTETTEEASMPPISEGFSTDFEINTSVICNPVNVCPNEDDFRYRMETHELPDETTEVEPDEIGGSGTSMLNQLTLLSIIL